MELSLHEIEEMLAVACHHLQSYFSTLDSARMNDAPAGMQLVKEDSSLCGISAQGGRSFDEIVSEFFAKVVPLSLNTASGGYLGYIPGGGIFLSALADFLTLSVNRYAGVNFTAPLLAKMEVEVIKWFAKFIGYESEKCGGVLCSGGSIANLTALIAARDHVLAEEHFHLGVVYGSGQTHLSCWKAAHAAGVRSANIKKVKLKSNYQMDHALLEEQIKQDLAAGLRPFLIIANAGTTDCGAVDDFPAIAKIASKYGLWLHVDGAYGGFFALTERGKKAFQGIELSDSFTLDPHKGLFLPYGTGALVVKNSSCLRKAYCATAGYITDTADENEFWDFSHTSLEMSRAARGLRVLLPLQYYGTDKFKELLDEKLDLCQWFHEKICADKNFEVLTPPVLSLFAFRYVPGGELNAKMDELQLNSLNKELLKKINDRQRVFLSGTEFEGKYYLRVAVLSYRTHMKNMQMLWEDLQAASGEIAQFPSLPGNK